MKVKFQLAVLFLLFATSACDKDSKIENVVTPITGWEDTQKVRILKVEQQKRLYTFPFNADSIYYVEYQYDESGKIKGFKTNHYFSALNQPIIVESENHIVSSTDKTINFDFSFSTVTYFNRSISSNQYTIENNRVMSVDGVFLTGEFIEASAPFERSSVLTYSANGLLNSISSKFSGLFVQGDNNKTLINITDYKGNEVISYSVKSYLSKNKEVDEEAKEAENYVVNVSYTIANEIPDGLKRMVNQAILGLSASGTEECYINPRLHTDLSFVDNGITINAQNDVFSDWIISFASSSIQTIPSQKSGIVSSKNIKGKRIKDGGFRDYYNIVNTTEVDSTANFPYIHDASAKTLEIAGLKIYYELVE